MTNLSQPKATKGILQHPIFSPLETSFAYIFGHETRPIIRRKKDWMWYHLGEEEVDQSRDRWTASAET